jgi:hypothetical protein
MILAWVYWYSGRNCIAMAAWFMDIPRRSLPAVPTRQ